MQKKLCVSLIDNHTHINNINYVTNFFEENAPSLSIDD